MSSKNQQPTSWPPPPLRGTTQPNQDPSTGGKEGTRNKEAAMQEAVMSGVETALRPVTTRLSDLRQQLDPIVAQINDNTVQKHAAMLESHLNPMNKSIETLQERMERARILHGVDQKFNVLDDAIRASHKDIQTVSGAQVTTKALTVDVFINSYQVYNSGCKSRLNRPFKIIPFIRDGGATVSPSDSGLPPLHDIPAINSVEDEELDLYLKGYNIDFDGLNRAAKLRKLRVYIGCTPEDKKQVSHTPTFLVMLLLGAACFVLFPGHFLSI
ncbi:hypothetical protein V8B97DRAFT_1484702 [Scleroderma yunnanense]